ncbi:MAG: phosphoribosylformylglycinamidine synthase I [Candidatus Omnitrophica bacterium]|nr:phosphoribosylformylglycinamidine synthase I [Candidatus Omnitrophota bacterium]MBD3269294.1 phosphoribosylformylglycinamidine synthase I [Candidatus Omnitrophota bacterium]
MKPKALVIRTAGTNCDKESVFALNMAGAATDMHHINYLRHNGDLSRYQIICIPGGFSYGDDLGAGKIFSLELSLWFKDEILNAVNRGALVIGICNGFQILAKTGILPDMDFKQKFTLTLNDSNRFEDRWVYLKVCSESVWLKSMPEIVSLPVAHGEGKFYAGGDVLERIEESTKVALRYVDKNGRIAGYPFNPNGSLNNIAGITDKTGRILGLMPHPERFIFKHHSPFWCNDLLLPQGITFFKNAVAYFKK